MFCKLVVISSFVAFTYGACHDAKNRSAASLGDPLVVGGTRAAKGEFPHQVTLQWGQPPYMPFIHMCGGSILNEYWILTAAHCLYDLSKYGRILVGAGKNEVKGRETTEQWAYAANMYIHEDYRGGVFPYDLALIKLATPLRLNEYVKAIQLPEPYKIPHGQAQLSGWGSISSTKQAILPNYLQKVTLPLLDIEVCRTALKAINEQCPVYDTNLCTGPLTGGFSACSGDSGGPLIAHNENGVVQVIGIVSWGHIPCATVGAPAVFVRVSAFINWIHNIINTHGA